MKSLWQVKGDGHVVLALIIRRGPVVGRVGQNGFEKSLGSCRFTLGVDSRRVSHPVSNVNDTDRSSCLEHFPVRVDTLCVSVTGQLKKKK